MDKPRFSVQELSGWKITPGRAESSKAAGVTFTIEDSAYHCVVYMDTDGSLKGLPRVLHYLGKQGRRRHAERLCKRLEAEHDAQLAAHAQAPAPA
jgi:hypothetical protein